MTATAMLLMIIVLWAALDLQPQAGSHVRSTNSRIRAAIDEGYARSETFRSLVDRLEASDVILHIEPGACTCDRARACLGFVSSAGGVRYLRSHISLRQIQRELIQQIGHELFHAWEVRGRAGGDEPVAVRAVLRRVARGGMPRADLL